ncbi:MAG: hypothetical protein HUU02_14300 [Bacteroidetes bacterium]|nr:hypothetical protein [Bacteroidota bacterium]
MQTALITIALLFILQPSEAQTPQGRKQQYIAAIFTRGAGWDTTKPPSAQPHFAEHGKNLQRLRASGVVALGARYGDYGMVVFRNGSIDSVRALFNTDTLVLKDILRMELHPFNPFYPGTIE